MEEAIKTVGGIGFCVFSPSEVRKYSTVEITVPETYDEDGMPVQGGLMDSRLGVLEPGQKCGTCGNTSARCPGHFGHIELAEPVLHVAFVTITHTLLVATCRSCGRILLPEDEVKAYREQIVVKGYTTPNIVERISKEIIAKAKKAKVCPHCGKKKLEVEFTKPHLFHEINDEGGAVRLLPAAIRERMERIVDDDLILLGFDPKSAKPEWLVLQVLPVPPVTVRPSITLETGIRSEDDLTHKLVDILRVNQRVRESKESGTPPLIVQDLVDLLQYHVTTYFDNEVSGIPQAHHRSGRPLKTISQRLKGKEGRFRGSLSGKRVDFSSRTVISPDPSLDISEVGVPAEVAKKLTVPEKVAPWNIEHLKTLVVNGPTTHPGANYIIRPDGVKIRLEFAGDRQAISEALAPGYVVERHLSDGDVVLFNRQPSLHRMSIMAHFVKVLPYRTFRLHPAVCPPYNADFDGDEMNLHVPQGEEARSEALTLMRVQDQLISPRYGGPIIGAIRDFLTAAFLLTKDGVFLTRTQFSNLAYAGGYTGEIPPPAMEEPEELYTGKQLFSLFLPKDFNYVLTSKWFKAKGGKKGKDVVVKEGVLESGVIDKASIGAEEPDTILHRIVKDYGTDAARSFLNSTLRILRAYITSVGFSFGFDELELNDQAVKEIADIIKTAYSNVGDLYKKYDSGKLSLIKGLRPEQALEQYIMSELSRARDHAGRVVERSLPDTNSGIVMAKTGARGSSLNLGQMTATVGQQSVRGKRITRGYYHRALPHFKQLEKNPDAYGFVKSNYRDGLDPIEFFFHAMGGREGLVDTAVRTQQSGYMQRRLVNAMEHVRVEYDSTVRDPQGNLIQFIYGEDGVDPSKSDHGKAVNVDRLIDSQELLDDKEAARIKENEAKTLVKGYVGRLNPKLAEELEESLKKGGLSKKAAKAVCEATVSLYKRALVEPGEAMGVVGAQSIGEPGTQMTLRTFHFAGVRERDVTLGLPRLIELVDARKQPSTPTMDVYLDEEHRVSQEKALEVAREILFTKVGDLVKQVKKDYEEISYEFVLDSEKMAERACTPESILSVIKSPKNKTKVDEKGRYFKILVDNFEDQASVSVRDKSMNTRVKGVPGILSVSVVQKESEWMVQTAGSNLGKVLKLPGVDSTRTTTNNIYEIAMNLGVEAARNAIVREILNTLDEQGLEVDVRHILLVADLMTSKGVLQQIGRHGIAGSKTSVLARAAFEITVPTLAEAAARGETEELKGVTENVIVGSTIPVGTGMVDIYMKSGE
ncbi:MAG TPA: DNA-directed RNA polymerase subunit A' [Conexivisphaerales archaeon]|nr:DNA-directed RNA polymerase subunit A' [Conexivisphaerales archaeon]